MPEPISATITSLKTAWDITKQLRALDDSLKVADMKAQLVTLLGSLTDARETLLEFREEMISKDNRIRELEEALELKKKLVRFGDAVYEVGEDGKPHGQSFCLKCWSDDHKQRPLLVSPNNYRQRFCPVCQTGLASDQGAYLE